MTETQKSIDDKHTFVVMPMNLNLKSPYELGKANYVSPAGTIITIPDKLDIDELEITFPPQEEDDLPLVNLDNNIHEVFENASIGLG